MITINGKTYTELEAQRQDFGTWQRRMLLTKSGIAKFAIFTADGEFDVWDTPAKTSKSKYTRVNMHS